MIQINLQEIQQGLFSILQNRKEPKLVEQLAKDLLMKLGVEAHKATINGEYKRVNE